MQYISIFLFLVGIISFFLKNRRHITLLVISIFSTNWFGFADPIIRFGNITFQNTDLALLTIFLLLPFIKKNKINDFGEIKKAFYYFLIFLFLSISFDMLEHHTTGGQVFRTLRNNGYLFFLFVLPAFSYKDLNLFLKIILFVTVIHSILYILQYIVGFSLTGPHSISYTKNGSIRYGNTPSYLIIMFVYVLYNINKSNNYKIIIFLFSIVIILSQSRGLLISAFSSTILFLYLNKTYKLYSLIFVGLVFVLGVIVVNSYFTAAVGRYDAGFRESQKIISGNIDYSDMNSFYHQGSFIFRWGVLYERFNYVIHDLSRIIFGVGYVPDFDLRSKIFVIGTASPKLFVGYEQYNTADMFLPNIITRYGIVGSVIYLYFLFKIFKFAYKNKLQHWGKILLTFLWSLVFISFASNTFYNGHVFFMIYILMGLTVSSRRENKNALIRL